MFVGANPDELRELGRLCGAKAGEIETVVAALSSRLGGTQWDGVDAEKFRSDWHRELRPRLDTIRVALERLDGQLHGQASDQEDASRVGRVATGTGYGASPLVAVETTSTTQVNEGSFVFSIIGASASSEVTMTRMSDGTYRISLESLSETSLGVGLERMLKAFGIALPSDVDLGGSVASASGSRVVFGVADEATALALYGFLSGETMDPSILVDSQTIWHDSTTLIHGASSYDVAGQFTAIGAQGNISLHLETTILAGGSVVRRSVSTNLLGGDGWTQDSEFSASVHEVTMDSSGNVVGYTIERSTVSSVDTRGGGEKTLDTAFGLIPFIDIGNTEADVRMDVHRLQFGGDALPSDMAADVAGGDFSALSGLVDGSSDDASETSLVYVGSSESATRGLQLKLAGGSQSTGYDSLQFSGGTHRAAGATSFVPVVDEMHGMTGVIVEEADGTTGVVYLAEY